MRRLGIQIGTNTPDMGHAREGVASIDGDGGAKPGSFLFRASLSFQCCSVLGGPAILPDYGRQQGRTGCIDKDVGVDLTADANCLQSGKIMILAEGRESAEYAGHPVVRVLLGVAM